MITLYFCVIFRYWANYWAYIPKITAGQTAVRTSQKLLTGIDRQYL